METVGKLKEKIDLNVYFRGLPAERKWLAIKKEKGEELEEETPHYQFKILTELEKRASEI